MAPHQTHESPDGEPALAGAETAHDESKPPHVGSRPWADACLAVILGILGFAVSAYFDLEERWHEYVDQHESIWELDELPVGLALMGLGFAWFAWRRSQDYARAARERHAANQALAHQLVRNREIIADLYAAREKALEHDRAKTRFLAHMSHELRTPLNAIIGFSELMQLQDYTALGPDNYKTYTASIRDSGYHLLELINDLLDLSRIESGDLTPNETPVTLGTLMDSAAGMFTERARSAGIRLTCRHSVVNELEVQVDGRMIRQVLINLLSNAIRYTPEGGAVDIATYRNDDGAFGFTVTDTGDGMDERVASRAQAGFGEVENAMRREHHGAGLGLPLSRSIMQAHGGNLTLKSKRGEGTRIDLWLPANRVLSAPMQGMVRSG